jgi:hypothetical protein
LVFPFSLLFVSIIQSVFGYFLILLHTIKFLQLFWRCYLWDDLMSRLFERFLHSSLLQLFHELFELSESLISEQSLYKFWNLFILLAEFFLHRIRTDFYHLSIILNLGLILAEFRFLGWLLFLDFFLIIISISNRSEIQEDRFEKSFFSQFRFF